MITTVGWALGIMVAVCIAVWAVVHGGARKHWPEPRCPACDLTHRADDCPLTL